MDHNTLSASILNELRQKGIISETEVVFKEGDLFVAKDVVTDVRRIIEYRGSMTENQGSKRLLKG